MTCQRIIAVGECFIDHPRLGSLCSVCCDNWLKQKEDDAWDEYSMADEEEEKQGLYSFCNSLTELRLALRSLKWVSAQENDAAAQVGLEVAE
ncbi:hypothetical protein [Planctopirus limnophila]|nr:hypothetical protein [Planctopirus limnophila]